MNELFIPDVGDGLAAGIYAGSGHSMEIDCGSQQAPEKSFAALKRVFPRTFVLSHFHTDHYNGLFHADPSFDIRHVFFPRLPVFQGREELLNCLLAMANRLFGGRSRSPEADLISEIQRISRKRVGWGGLSSGDKVDLEGTQIDVLWPPRTLIDSEVLKVIRNAINDFGEAKRKDSELRKLYDAVEKAGKAQLYLKEEEGRSEPDKAEQVDVKPQIGHRPLPTR